MTSQVVSSEVGMSAVDTSEADTFYARVPTFDGFATVMDPALYEPLPDGWVVGLTDVVHSTAAIEAGGYKRVNTAGAAIIAALGNALRGRDFPFVFGGDGASFAVASGDMDIARRALAETVTFAREELGLSLRAALVPVEEIRAHGWDVRVAAFAASANVRYAMFSGGGLAWASQAMKRGEYAIAPAPPGARPDLTGLSCRWQEMPASRGLILSIIVQPARGQVTEEYRKLIERVLALSGEADAGSPMPEGGPSLAWSREGLEVEARTQRGQGMSLVMSRIRTWLIGVATFLIFALGLRIGGFDPKRYRREQVENADFRKYEDGLRMTLDCAPALADRIESELATARQAGIADYGLHRQTAAIMTCIVPSVMQSNHVHFIDGASGGYAVAAAALKAIAA